MANFGKNSKKHRETLHPDLKKVADKAIELYDFSIIWGHRGEEEQNKAFTEGNSTKKWPDSRHNSLPSEAMDLLPYPTQWETKKEEWYYFAGLIIGIAYDMGIKLKWGGRFMVWKNGKLVPFFDGAHFELLKD